jgi:hypothetical protein
MITQSDITACAAYLRYKGDKYAALRDSLPVASAERWSAHDSAVNMLNAASDLINAAEVKRDARNAFLASLK